MISPGAGCRGFLLPYGRPGYFYFVTIMNDYSRFILSWKLEKDMRANYVIEVIREAVDVTRAFRNYLHLVGIRHILAVKSLRQSAG